MKRHHEDNPYSSNDSGETVTSHSVPKRMATRNHSQSNNGYSIAGNYSPPSSIGSDNSSSSSCSLNTTGHPNVNSIDKQLCRCPNEDCVIHDRGRSRNIPDELQMNSNPIYGNTNLLLYYAHLERCRRHGLHFHQHTSSS